MKKKIVVLLNVIFVVGIVTFLFCILNIQEAKAQTQREDIKQEQSTENNSNIKIQFEETQTGMNEHSCQIAKQTDKELNDVYKQILEKYKDNKLFISKLEKAQSAWIKFRDAHLESIYPEEDTLLHYGSVYPMCANGIMTGMTQQRIIELKSWLKGICEGNVCAGSRGYSNAAYCTP